MSLAVVAAIWGATFVLVKNALDDSSTVLFLALRFTLATIALGAITRPKPGPWLGGVVTGALLFAGYVLQTMGLRLTTPAKSGFITGLYMVLVPLISSLVYFKVPKMAEIGGVVLAFIGLGMLTLTGSGFHVGLGDALTAGCAIVYSIHILVLGYYSRRTEHAWLALVQIGTCGVLGLATFWWIEPPFVRWTGRLAIALGVTALLATALAFAVQTWAQRHTTPTRAALVFSLEPVFAWITSFIVEHEVLSGRAMAGALLILAGILLVELKPVRAPEHQNQ
jgi:drug/metabolite transporter (DMT)-like permease